MHQDPSHEDETDNSDICWQRSGLKVVLIEESTDSTCESEHILLIPYRYLHRKAQIKVCNSFDCEND